MRDIIISYHEDQISAKRPFAFQANQGENKQTGDRPGDPSASLLWRVAPSLTGCTLLSHTGHLLLVVLTVGKLFSSGRGYDLVVVVAARMDG